MGQIDQILGKHTFCNIFLLGRDWFHTRQTHFGEDAFAKYRSKEAPASAGDAVVGAMDVGGQTVQVMRDADGDEYRVDADGNHVPVVRAGT